MKIKTHFHNSYPHKPSFQQLKIRRHLEKQHKWRNREEGDNCYTKNEKNKNRSPNLMTDIFSKTVK